MLNIQILWSLDESLLLCRINSRATKYKLPYLHWFFYTIFSFPSFTLTFITFPLSFLFWSPYDRKRGWFYIVISLFTVYSRHAVSDNRLSSISLKFERPVHIFSPLIYFYDIRKHSINNYIDIVFYTLMKFYLCICIWISLYSLTYNLVIWYK